VTTYPYQPLLALLLEPLTLLPCSTALHAWWQFSFLLWGIVTFWFARDATRRYGAGRGLLVGALCLIYRPIWNGLTYGQIHLLVLFIFVLASRFTRRQQPGQAGSVLAVGSIFKYVPAILVAYHLVRGRYRVAVGAALTGIALLAVEILIVGPGTLAGSIGGATADVAFYAALHRSWLTIVPDGVWLARLMLLATFVASAVMTWRKWAVNEALGEGLVLCAALLAMPLAWYHYLTWLLPLLVALLHAALDGTRTIPPGLSLAAVVRRLPLLGFALPLGMLLVPGPEELLVGPALLMLWVVCGTLYLITARHTDSVIPRVPVPARLVEQNSATM
jgi:hypothetical protein